MYRELKNEDYSVIAEYKNLNNQREDPVWCKTNIGTNKEVIKARVIYEGLWGNIVSQVHEKNEAIISLFIGVEHKKNTTYFIGVVDLSLEDVFDTWRKDAARCFETALARGMETIRMKMNESDCWIVEWMRDEVGMVKHPKSNVWKADKDIIQEYINSQNERYKKKK